VRKLELESEMRGDVAILYVDGYLNSLLAETLEKSVLGKMGDGYMKFIMDFDRTRMINSIGISIVIGIVKSITEKGGVLAFTHLSRVNRELFDITGVSGLVKVFKDKEEALLSMSAVA